jgi:glutathione synthase/RimK-type ligase-like ATP-grasp enzyme
MSGAVNGFSAPGGLKAVLFKSDERFDSFLEKLSQYGIATTVLDFGTQEWTGFDYSDTDLLIYYPSFKFSSNHPLALQEVYDNLTFINSNHPHIKIFPDPKGIPFYSDKYRQYLFLKTRGYPIPETYPLFSRESIDLADRALGYPMILKNRYGAGGDYVFRIYSKKELVNYYNISKLDLFNLGAARFFLGMLGKRIFYWSLIKARKADYPFLSPPLLAQKYVKMDRDLKTVTGDFAVVEGHWRFQANEQMWKVNIDGGGTGVWSEIPAEAMDLSVRLARDLDIRWLNIDLIRSDGKFLITEFSPVWHHYAYREKPGFVYKDDYNIPVPLEISLDLERIIVESLISAAKDHRTALQSEPLIPGRV